MAEFPRRALVALAGVIALVAAPVPTSASTDDSARYRALQALDTRLHQAGWRLATGNAPFCRDTVPATGLLLHDASAYPDPAAARKALGLTGDIAVQAVADGSPAARAGLAADATLVTIAGADAAMGIAPGDPRWQRLQTVLDRLEATLASDGQVILGWQHGNGAPAMAPIAAVPACRTRFEVAGIGNRAVADGARVVFGDRFAGFTYSDDLLAAAAAHELAHNLLSHRVWLDANGRAQRNVRLTEREADRLMPWLLANAGYDPIAAVRFMQAWGPRHGGGLFRKRTHDGWDERVEAIEAELPLIASVRDAAGSADWARHFRREIAP